MQGSVPGDGRLWEQSQIRSWYLLTECVPCVRDPNSIRHQPVPFILIEEGPRGSAKGLTFAQRMIKSPSIFWSKEEGIYEEGTWHDLFRVQCREKRVKEKGRDAPWEACNRPVQSQS